jgi:hypothetical protein
MKVLDLRCANGHRFEGWFASDDDYRSQRERGLVECPMCAERAVERMPSAPRLNVTNLRQDAPAPAAAADDGQARLQAAWLQAMRHVVENTEDVGDRFPEEARRIHYGEVEQRGIRGQASREDADALRDEGIEVAVLPLPPALKGPAQ